jgi:SPP1 family predicted phage head-tail adaptor
MPRARQLRDRVAFEERDRVVDELGNEEGAFVARFSCAAGIRAKFGGEAVTAARLAGEQPAILTVRQTEATREVTTDWRVRDERTGVIYNIRSIADPDGGRVWLELLCQTGVAT